MSSETITFPNINYGSAINPGEGAFTPQMLSAAIGLSGGCDALAIAVQVGALAQPDFRPSDSPMTWLWKPDTVQSYMTAAAAATVRSAVAAAYVARNPGRTA